MAVANRTAISRALDFSRLSSSFIRTFTSSSPSTSSSNPNASPSSSQTKRRKKKKNLFEVIQFLPNWGVGYHVAKSHWDEISYQITKINLYKVCLSSLFFRYISLCNLHKIWIKWFSVSFCLWLHFLYAFK